ncbi:MAG: hypothetical protein PWQ93_137 [Clostridiales bacterium]|nr:hypothetical protein [Clostridiales bacterium]
MYFVEIIYTIRYKSARTHFELTRSGFIDFSAGALRHTAADKGSTKAKSDFCYKRDQAKIKVQHF